MSNATASKGRLQHVVALLMHMFCKDNVFYKYLLTMGTFLYDFNCRMFQRCPMQMLVFMYYICISMSSIIAFDISWYSILWINDVLWKIIRFQYMRFIFFLTSYFPHWILGLSILCKIVCPFPAASCMYHSQVMYVAMPRTPI